MRENLNQVFSDNSDNENNDENRRRFFIYGAGRYSGRESEEKIRRGEQPEKAMLTDRDLWEYEKFLQIDAGELAGKTILDLGSGEFQKFARQLAHRFSDTKIICLDASLAKRHGDFLLSESQRARKINLISALFTKLPFQSNSFDAVFSLFGTLYLTTSESKRVNIGEIARILKPGGAARLYPYYDRPYDAPLDEVAAACGVSYEIIPHSPSLPALRGKDHFSEAMQKAGAYGNEGMLILKKLLQA